MTTQCQARVTFFHCGRAVARHNGCDDSVALRNMRALRSRFGEETVKRPVFLVLMRRVTANLINTWPERGRERDLGVQDVIALRTQIAPPSLIIFSIPLT